MNGTLIQRTGRHWSDPALRPLHAISRVISFAKVLRKLQRAGRSFEGGQVPPHAAVQILKESCLELSEIHGLNIQQTGQLPQAPSIIVSNHLGYLDPLIIAGLTPVIPIAKTEVSQWPMLGTGLRNLGCIFVKREDPNDGARVLRSALRLLELGISVLVFPEGTTTDGQSVLPFKRGIFGIAALADVPVIPTTITLPNPKDCWLDDQSFINHYLQLVMRSQTAIKVHFDAPLYCSGKPTQDANMARELIEGRMRRQNSVRQTGLTESCR